MRSQQFYDSFWHLFAAACLLAGWMAAPVHGQAPLLLREAAAPVDIGTQVHLLRDPDQTLTLADVRASAAWAPPGGPLAFGYTDDAYWVRLRLTSEDGASQEAEWLLEVADLSLDAVDVYVSDGAGDYRHFVTGDARPFEERTVPHRMLIVPLPAPADSSYTVYVRVASQGPVAVPLRVWTEDGFARHDRRAYAFLGLFFGALLVMLGYNAFLGLTLRDRVYLFYVLYLGCFIGHQLAVERVAFMLLWPDALWWNARAATVLGLLSVFFALQFSWHFLSTDRYLPRLDPALRHGSYVLLAFVALTLLAPVAWVKQGAVLAIMVTATSALLAGVLTWRRGNRVAVYYLIGWVFLVAGLLVGLAGFLGVGDGPLWGVVRAGTVAEITLLSLGLGYRIDLLRAERERMRLRIAGDLHDEIGSGLTLIALQSDLIRSQRKNGHGIAPDATERVTAWADDIGTQARALTASIQDIIWAVNPADEGWEGLEARMHDYALKLLGAKGIAFEMTGERVGTGDALPLGVRRHALLIFKEVLHNAVKHARCTAVTVRWRLGPDALSMQICDDGQGFDPDAVRKGHGLASLQHRAEQAGGTLTVQTAPGASTCVDMRLPVVERQPEIR